MTKLYKDGVECSADESQLADMKAAGWSTTAEAPVKPETAPAAPAAVKSTAK